MRAEIIDDRFDHDDEMIIAMNKRNPEVFDVYRVDLKTKELTLIAENPGNITGWVTDHTGCIRLALATDGVNASILHRPNEQTPFKTVITTNFKEQIQPLFFDFDNKLLFASSNINRDKLRSCASIRQPPRRKASSSSIPRSTCRDLAGRVSARSMTEVQFVTWKRERKFFDAEMEAIQNDLERQLPGYEIDLQSQQSRRKHLCGRSVERSHPWAFAISTMQRQRS